MVRVLVLCGGDMSAMPPVELPPFDRVIAADSGLHWAETLGLHVDLVVGDMDSVEESSLAAFEREGAEVDRHPAAKDQTDLELAVRAAVAAGADSVTVVGGGGGRLDHLLGNLLLLAHDDFAAVELTAVMPPATVTVVRQTPRELSGDVGDYVSLFAVGSPARGVSTEGLLYDVGGRTVRPGSTLGVSNELVATDASVVAESGVLLAVQPGQR